MMRDCERCLENTWDYFNLPDGWIRANCNMCSYEVIFKSSKISETGDPCRKCKTPVVLFDGGKLSWKRQRREFHFCKWLKCPKCLTTYYLNKYKVRKGQACDCERTQLPAFKVIK